MQQTRLERTTPEPQDDFWPYCIAGLLLAGAVAACSFGLRYTPW
jgi:hypothetical protein